MRIKISIFLMASLGLLFACKKKDDKTMMGYQPVYEDTANLLAITFQPQGQALQNGGKIFLLGDTLYQVETDKGIHIFDLRDKAHPKNVGFIAIRGCKEVAATGNTIFTNNQSELLAIRLLGNKLTILERVPEIAFGEATASLPPERGYFECPIDIPGKKITGWKKVPLSNPKCHF